MASNNAAAISVLSFRILYGLGLIAVPQRLAGRWLGSASEQAPTQVPLRALGAREVAIHAFALRSVLSGSPVSPWLAASIAGDLTDVAATTAARKQLPDGAAKATWAVGGCSALITALVALALGR